MEGGKERRKGREEWKEEGVREREREREEEETIEERIERELEQSCKALQHYYIITAPLYYIHLVMTSPDPPSRQEKQSGELSQISWVSAHFCDSVT